MKRVSAAVSFLFVFACVFVLGGLFLMPYLPPFPDRPVSAFEGQFWTTNWAGALLGIVLGALSARSILKKKPASPEHP
jgi:hypothetical protein